MPLMPVASVQIGSAGYNDIQLDYVESTSGLTVTATSEGTSQTYLTSGAITCDGTTRLRFEFYAADLTMTGSGTGVIVLYEDSTAIGWLGEWGNATASLFTANPASCVRYRTPAAGSHTYTIRAFKTAGTAAIGAGAGGTGADMPSYLRISTSRASSSSNYMPGYEIAYAEVTSNVTVSATAEATPTDIISLGALSFDGSPIILEFYCANAAVASGTMILVANLWDDTTDLERWFDVRGGNATTPGFPIYARRRIVPTAGTHTFKVRGIKGGGLTDVTMFANAGSAGAGTYSPIWMRATKV